MAPRTYVVARSSLDRSVFIVILCVFALSYIALAQQYNRAELLDINRGAHHPGKPRHQRQQEGGKEDAVSGSRRKKNGPAYVLG